MDAYIFIPKPKLLLSHPGMLPFRLLPRDGFVRLSVLPPPCHTGLTHDLAWMVIDAAKYLSTKAKYEEASYIS